MSGYATERAGADAVERGSSMLEAINEIRSGVNEAMLRVKRFNTRHFGPLPPQPTEPSALKADGLVGQSMPTQGQFYHSKNAILSDLRELNQYLSNMENLI